MALTSMPKIKVAAQIGDAGADSPQKRTGSRLALVGFLIAGVAFVANLVAYQAGGDAAVTAWSFGLTTLGFATTKVAIAVVLVGILVRLFMRVEGMKAALPLLVPNPRIDTTRSHPGSIIGSSAPRPLRMHRMAQRMWAPMVAMGAMAVGVGFLTSLAWAGGSTSARAWTQGIQFLGEALVLAGISFLLGSILAGLRAGGGEVQEHVGVAVHTMKMPRSAKAFMALMVSGLALGVVQFIGYVSVASVGEAAFAQANAWLGPLRELSLGLLLSGIVLALATIARALTYQFDRVVELINTGR